MIHHVTTDEAKARLNQLIDAAIEGDVVVIAKDDGEIVQLVPLSKNRNRPQFGSGRGMMVMSEDFDEPLTDFEEYMP